MQRDRAGARASRCGRSPVAAQSGGALARRDDQRGAPAVLREGFRRERDSATIVPSGSRATQPASSQAMPSRSVVSVGGARVGIGGEPFAHREGVAADSRMTRSRPSAPRTATASARRRRPARPAAASRSASSAASATSAAPAPAQRRAQQAQHEQPGGAEQQRPDAERRHRGRPRPAGSRPTARPRSSSRCPAPSAARASRRSRTACASSASRPAGITQTDTIGIASRLASTP